MRTKALLGLAVLAAGALAASAQTSVYSLNVVGYYTVTIPAGKYQLIANQMVGTNYTVANLLAGVPANTQVLKWNGASYTPNNFDPDLGWDNPDMTLGPGEAAFVKNSSANPLSITFVGEVNQNTNTLNLPVGYSTASLFTPQAGNLATDFGFAAHANDQVLLWNGASFTPATFDPDFGWDPQPAVSVGQGFFFNLKQANTWTRSFTVQ